MRSILSLLLLVVVLPTMAANRITSYIVVTNAPIGNTNTLTVNSSVRTFTNSVSESPATLIQETNSIPWTATNILNHLTLYPVSGAHVLGQNASNTVSISGGVGEALSVTLAGFWGYITNTTQTVSSPTFMVRVPLTVEAATNQQSIASLLVQGMSDSSTQAFATNSTSISNLLQKGAGPQQTVAGPVKFTGTTILSIGSATNLDLFNSTNRGYVSALTNGIWTNATLMSPKMTNGENYGSAFRSPNATHPSSDNFGSGATVGGGNAIAVGPSSLAQTNGAALGYLSSAGNNGVAIGAGADGSVSTNSVGIGQNVNLGIVSNAVAVGQGATVGDYHHNSAAIGQGATTTTNNQVRLGGSSHTVSIPGMLEISGTQTNTTFRGTNVFNGRLDLKSRADASLANGNNSAIVLGTNVYVRLSGATTIAALAGFAAEQDGSFHVVQFSGAVTNIFLNESGVDPTAANRLVTGTGADLSLTNTPLAIGLIYDGTASRWRIISLHR